MAHHAGGHQVALPAGQLPVACAARTGYAASESTIAVTNHAVVFSPAHTENTLARSTDGGRSWSLAYPAAEQYTSFWNTVDPDVVADRRTGWLFWSHATGPVRTEGTLPQGAGFWLAAAQGFQVYASRDNGRTFSTADYSTAPTGDWEKVFVGPAPPASTGAPQPHGYPGVVYLCANSPFEVMGPGRLCYRSLDGARTFEVAGYVTLSPGSPSDICPPLNFNTGVVDSRGTTYQPVTCGNAAYVAVSHDEGSTYEWLTVPHVPAGPIFGGNYLQVAVDDADTLYAMWPADGLLYLMVSRTHGRTWGAPMMVSGPGLHTATKPVLTAGAPGHVGIAYYASRDPQTSRLSAYVTQTADATAAHPLFVTAALNDPRHPIFTDYGLTGGSPRTDFVGAAYDPVGTHLWLGMVEQLSAPDPAGNIETVGYVGHLARRG